MLVDIKDFGGLLPIDELWDALAQPVHGGVITSCILPLAHLLTVRQEADLDSVYRKFKPYPAAEGYTKLGSPK